MQMRKIALFEEKEIRKVWYNDDWYFSVIDVVGALSESNNPRRYWSDLKIKLEDEGQNIELYDNFVQLKLESKDGKKYSTDCADTKGILRIIQSIPSPKAEPFKLWLAEVGNDRIEEVNNPELAVNRAIDIYDQKGYSKIWIEQRIQGIKNRKKLTEEWKNRGAKQTDYGILTNQIYKYGFGETATEMKETRGLSKKANVRDSFSEIELALTNLGEVAAKEIHIANDSFGLEELKEDTKDAGIIINNTKKQIENKINNKKKESV